LTNIKKIVKIFAAMQGTATPARIARYIMEWNFEFEGDLPLYSLSNCPINPLLQHSK
jgi:hypothetical protein